MRLGDERPADQIARRGIDAADSGDDARPRVRRKRGPAGRPEPLGQPGPVGREQRQRRIPDHQPAEQETGGEKGVARGAGQDDRFGRHALTSSNAAFLPLP